VEVASQKLGIDITAVDRMMFMPKPPGYFVVTNDGTNYWHDVPDTLDVYLKTKGGENIWSLSAGQSDSWVTITNSGDINWCDIPMELEKKLKNSRAGDIAVRSMLNDPSLVSTEGGDNSMSNCL
jgi:hypothetical protein